MKEYYKKNPQQLNENSCHWKGGVCRGYRIMGFRDADGKRKQTPEHRYIYEQHIGRNLL